MRASLAFILLAACGAPPAPVELTLGTTDVAGAGFFPLEGDQPLVFGTQSGFHVWLTVRVSGRAPGGTALDVATARASDGAPDLESVWPEDIDALGPGGAWQLPVPLPAFLCPSRPGVDVDGVPVRIHVKLVEPHAQAVLAVATSEFTPHCPTEDPSELADCQRLCSGNPL